MTDRFVLRCCALALLACSTAACGSPAASVATDDPARAELSSDAQAALSRQSDMLVPVKHVIEGLDAGLAMTFLDARTPLDYEMGHIAGAINIPYYEAADRVGELDPDKLYIVYCECPHAEAVQLADEMVAAGFGDVKVIDEGLYGWTQAGREIVPGTPEPQPNGG